MLSRSAGGRHRDGAAVVAANRAASSSRMSSGRTARRYRRPPSAGVARYENARVPRLPPRTGEWRIGARSTRLTKRKPAKTEGPCRELSLQRTRAYRGADHVEALPTRPGADPVHRELWRQP